MRPFLCVCVLSFIFILFMCSKFFSEYYHLSDYFSPPTDSARWHSPSKIPFRCALYGCVNKNFSSNIKSNSDAIICEPQVTILSLLLSGWKLGLDQPRSTFFVSTHAHTHTPKKATQRLFVGLNSRQNQITFSTLWCGSAFDRTVTWWM